MKTKEELNAIKEELTALSRKLAELTEEELAQITGGLDLEPVKTVIRPIVGSDLKEDRSCPKDTLK